MVGVDIEIRPQNRAAIEEHILSPYITLIEATRRAHYGGEGEGAADPERVLVLLDSCHSKEHVLAELNAYAPLVTVGSYIVAMDGIMQDLAGAPRSQADWAWNNPAPGSTGIVERESNFQIEEPEFPFNRGNIRDRVTCG